MLLGEKRDDKPLAMYRYQYHYAPLYQDRLEALGACAENAQSDSLCARVVLLAMNDTYPGIRRMAMDNLSLVGSKYNPEIKPLLIGLAEGDKDSRTRGFALSILAERFNAGNFTPLFLQGLSDPSYLVIGEALRTLSVADPERALVEARNFYQEENSSIRSAILELLAEHGTAEDDAFFKMVYPSISGFDKIGFVNAYFAFLQKQKDLDLIKNGLWIFQDMSTGDGPWYLRFYGIQTLLSFQAAYNTEKADLKEQIDKEEASEAPGVELIELRSRAKKVDEMATLLSETLAEIKEKEKDERLKRLFDPAGQGH